MSNFIKELTMQVRALDAHGYWDKLSDSELLTMKFVKTKEQLKDIPMLGEISEMQMKDLRLIFQALALYFERKTGVMSTVLFEMNHEGFGRAVVIADKIVIVDKYFKDAHRFGYKSLEAMGEDGEKLANKAVEIYNKYSIKE
jgi:probable nitrogen fixation protein